MKSVGPSRDEPCLVVETFDEPVAQAGPHVGENPCSELPDGSRELHEGPEAAACGPSRPPFQLGSSNPRLLAVQNRGKGLFQDNLLLVA